MIVQPENQLNASTIKCDKDSPGSVNINTVRQRINTICNVSRTIKRMNGNYALVWKVL